MHICIYTYTRTCIYRYMHTYIMHTYIHTYIHYINTYVHRLIELSKLEHTVAMAPKNLLPLRLYPFLSCSEVTLNLCACYILKSHIVLFNSHLRFKLHPLFEARNRGRSPKQVLIGLTSDLETMTSNAYCKPSPCVRAQRYLGHMDGSSTGVPDLLRSHQAHWTWGARYLVHMDGSSTGVPELSRSHQASQAHWTWGARYLVHMDGSSTGVSDLSRSHQASQAHWTWGALYLLHMDGSSAGVPDLSRSHQAYQVYWTWRALYLVQMDGSSTGESTRLVAFSSVTLHLRGAVICAHGWLLSKSARTVAVSPGVSGTLTWRARYLAHKDGSSTGVPDLSRSHQASQAHCLEWRGISPTRMAPQP
jgi:hypothetical protein